MFSKNSKKVIRPSSAPAGDGGADDADLDEEGSREEDSEDDDSNDEDGGDDGDADAGAAEGDAAKANREEEDPPLTHDSTVRAADAGTNASRRPTDSSRSRSAKK